MAYTLNATMQQDYNPTYRANDGASGALHRIATLVGQYFRYRRDYKQVQKLPDHLLKDIGLTRADIYRAMKPLRF